MTLLSVVGAAFATGLLFPARTPTWSSAGRRTMGDLARWSTPVGVLAAGGLLATAQGTTLALGLILLATTAGSARLVAAARLRTRARARQARVVEVCEMLAGELRSGQPPVTAIEHCVEAWPAFAPVATAAQLGADVPVALRRLAETPGARGLHEVAAAWVVSQGAGAGLAVALGQVAASARDSQATQRLITAELSSAQATARLVAGLPLVTLLMGSGVGGDPWRFLLQTPAGVCCLAAGLGLAVLGLTWIERIAASVMRG